MKRIFIIGCFLTIAISNSLCAPSEISESYSDNEETLQSIRSQSPSDSIEDGFLKLTILENRGLISGENTNITQKRISKDVLPKIPDESYQQLERPPLEKIDKDGNDFQDLLVRHPKSSDIISNDNGSHDRWVTIARMILIPLRVYLEHKFPIITPLVVALAVKIVSCFGRIAEIALTTLLSNGSIAVLPGKFFFCQTSLAIVKKLLGLLQIVGTGLSLMYSTGNKSLASSAIHDSWSSSRNWETDVKSYHEESKSFKELLVHQAGAIEPEVYPVIEKSKASSEYKTDIFERFVTDWTSSTSRTHLIANFHDLTWKVLEEFILNPLEPFSGLSQAEFNLAKTRIATWCNPIISNIFESLVNLLLMTYNILENLITGIHTNSKINLFYEKLIYLIKDLPPDTTMSELCIKVSNHLKSNWHEIRGNSKLLACYENLTGFLKMIPGYWKISHIVAIGNAIVSHYHETFHWFKSCLTNLFELSTKTIQHKERRFRMFLSAVATLPRVLSEIFREKIEFLTKTILRKIINVKERLLELFDLKGLVRSFTRAWSIILELCLDSLKSLILPLRTLDPLPALLDVTRVRSLAELGEHAKLASFWEAGLKLFSVKFLEKPLMPLKDLIVASNLVQEEAIKILVKSFEFFLDLIYVILEKFESKKIFHFEHKSQESDRLDQSSSLDESCESTKKFQGHFRNIQTSSNYVRLEETRKESMEQMAETYQDSNVHGAKSESHDAFNVHKLLETDSQVSNARSQWLKRFFKSMRPADHQKNSTPLSRWITRFASRLHNHERNVSIETEETEDST